MVINVLAPLPGGALALRQDHRVANHPRSHAAMVVVPPARCRRACPQLPCPAAGNALTASLRAFPSAVARVLFFWPVTSSGSSGHAWAQRPGGEAAPLLPVPSAKTSPSWGGSLTPGLPCGLWWCSSLNFKGKHRRAALALLYGRASRVTPWQQPNNKFLNLHWSKLKMVLQIPGWWGCLFLAWVTKLQWSRCLSQAFWNHREFQAWGFCLESPLVLPVLSLFCHSRQERPGQLCAVSGISQPLL